MPVKNLQSFRLPIIRKPATTEVVHTRGRKCVCNFSGFSKRIPRLEHPRVVYTFPDVHRQLYRVRTYINLFTELKESGAL